MCNLRLLKTRLFISLRFDVRLLVTSFPTLATSSGTPATQHDDDETWEDLPSEAEDNFFLSSEEIEKYRLRKRLELMERNRLERIRQAEDAEQINSNLTSDRWGGSDEEVCADPIDVTRGPLCIDHCTFPN